MMPVAYLSYEKDKEEKSGHLDALLHCNTEDPRYNNSFCYQRFCCKIEFAVIKKLNTDPSIA